jgi:hypothetical protein
VRRRCVLQLPALVLDDPSVPGESSYRVHFPGAALRRDSQRLGAKGTHTAIALAWAHTRRRRDLSHESAVESPASGTMSIPETSQKKSVDFEGSIQECND